MFGSQMPATISTGTVGQASYPTNRFVENSYLEEQERRSAEQRQNMAPLLGLSSFLQRQWEEAKTAKQHIQERLIRNLRQRNGHYNPEVQAEINKLGGSDIFLPLTANKCRAGVSLLSDIILPVDDRAWDLMPTPEPEMPPDIEQALIAQLASEVSGLPEEVVNQDFMLQLEERWAEFDERAREILKTEALEARDAMRALIEDQLAEGGWDEAMSAFLEDLVTFPTAFIRGPIVRRRPTFKYNRERGLVMSYELRLELERVSPFDIYPSPYSRNLQDGYFFHRSRMQISDLEAMKGVSDYDSMAINQVIALHGAGGLREWLSHDQERATEEGRPHDYLQRNGTLETLEYYGPAHGQVLREWGMTPEQVPDASKAYEVRATKIGRYIVMARVNEHLVAKRPYWSTSYEKVPDSIWGKGICDLVEPSQRMANATARALANNMGFASGPQVVINDPSRLPPGWDFTTLRPWGTWPMGKRDPGPGGERPPVEFFQPASNAGELMAVLDFFSRQADEHVGIPPYAYGSSERSKGAGETASGQSMLMSQMNKGQQRVVLNVDMDVTSQVIEAMYQHNLRYSDDPTIKGDLRAVARGASSIMAREIRTQRLIETLQLTANPIDLQIIGVEGRAKMLRAAVKDLVDDPAEDILPSDREFEGVQMPVDGEQPEQGPEPPSPVDLAKVDVERERVDIERQKAAREAESKERVEMRKAEHDLELARLRETAAIEKTKLEQRQLDIEERRLDIEADKVKRDDERQRDAAKRDETAKKSEERATQQETRVGGLEALIKELTNELKSQGEGRAAERAEDGKTLEALRNDVMAAVSAVESKLDEKIAGDEKLRDAVFAQIDARGGPAAKAAAKSVMRHRANPS